MTIRAFDPVLRLLLALSLVLVTAACDNPVEDEHEDHPVGLALVNAQGQDVVTVTEGRVVTGQVVVPVGGSQTLTVFALGEDGDRLALGDELAARVATQPQNATVALQGNQLTVAGRTAGTATFELELLHEGHAELSGDVPVVVQ